MHSPSTKRNHRILGLALSLAMVFSLFSFSVPAFAAGEGEVAEDEESAVVSYNGTDYVSLKAALNNVDTTDEEADVLVLLKDIDMDAFDDLTEEQMAAPTAENGVIDKTITLDLNGHRITGSDPVALLVTPEGKTPEEVTVTLTNSSTEKTGIIRNDYGKEAVPAEPEDPDESTPENKPEDNAGTPAGEDPAAGAPGEDTVLPPADGSDGDAAGSNGADDATVNSDDPAKGTPAASVEEELTEGAAVAAPAEEENEKEPEETEPAKEDGTTAAPAEEPAGDPEGPAMDPAEPASAPQEDTNNDANEEPAATAVKGNFVLAEGAVLTDDENGTPAEEPGETGETGEGGDVTEPGEGGDVTEPGTEEPAEPVDITTLSEIIIDKAKTGPVEPEGQYKLTVKTYFNGKAFTGSQSITIGTDNAKEGIYAKYTSVIGPTTASKYENIAPGEEISITNPATKCYGAVSVKANGVELGGAKNMTITIEEDTVLEVTYGKTGKFIFIDPGHGGSDPGSSSKFDGKRYTEKARMWVLSGKLVDKLNTYDNIVAVRDRKSIESCPDIVLRGKASKGYDLFVSLHSNAGPSSADYPLVIVPYESKYKTAVKSMADDLASMMKSTMGTKQSPQVWSRTWKFNGVTKNYYGVIRGAAEVKTPGIIIEHSFNTNKKSMLWLMSDSNLQKMANNEASIIASWGKANKWSSPLTAATVTVKTDLDITGANYPTRIVKGRSYTVKGTVTSASGLKRVKIGITNTSGTWITGHVLDAKDLDGKTFDVAQANSALDLKTLPKGKYYYRIQAYNVNGVSSRLLNKSFVVGGPEAVISGYNYPKSIKKGKPYSIKGTITSPTKIKRVQIGVVKRSTGKWVSYAKYDSKSVNAIKFDVKKADSSLRFRKLPRGRYYYRIVVTNQDGTYRVLNKAFKVK